MAWIYPQTDMCNSCAHANLWRSRGGHDRHIGQRHFPRFVVVNTQTWSQKNRRYMEVHPDWFVFFFFLYIICMCVWTVLWSESSLFFWEDLCQRLAESEWRHRRGLADGGGSLMTACVTILLANRLCALLDTVLVVDWILQQFTLCWFNVLISQSSVCRSLIIVFTWTLDEALSFDLTTVFSFLLLNTEYHGIDYNLTVTLFSGETVTFIGEEYFRWDANELTNTPVPTPKQCKHGEVAAQDAR